MKKIITTLLLTATLSMGFLNSAKASAQPYIGDIIMGGWNFCPRGFTDAAGQILAISSYSALFSLYGTMYGGDGRTTFGLPDLRGRSAVGYGNGPGLPNTSNQGEKGGSTSFTLTVNQIPSHSHSVLIKEGRGGQTDATNRFLAEAGVYRSTGANTSLNSATIGNTGGNQAVNKRSPYQVIRYCVALVGIFPSRT